MGKKSKRRGQQSYAGPCCSEACGDCGVDKDVLVACQKIFELVSLDTPVLPTKQWEEHLKLRTLVEKIREKQTDLSLFGASDHSRQDNIAGFIKWFNENGGKADSVEIGHYGQQGLGLKAIADIKSGELFASIPRKLMMSAETARNSELAPLIEKDNILRVMQNACLVLHVYCEKLKKNSFWKPYLDILPTSYSTTLYFSIDEMQDLKGSPAFSEALKLYRNIARQYAYLYQRIQQFSPETAKLPLRNHFTFDDHRWAVSTVITRQNKIPSTTGEPTLALIPMWDICNHSNGTITTGYVVAEDSCQSFSMKDFSAGEQVYIFYGERSNADLLVHNGFVYESNSHDRVTIQLGVSKSDPLYSLKETLLTALRMTASFHSYTVLCDCEPFGPELVAFLRVFCMKEDELTGWLEKANEASCDLSKLSDFRASVCKEETEIKCWQFLETRLSLLLGQYGTTEQEDSDLLANEELSHHKKLCIQLKRAERQVLQNALKRAIELKNSTESELETGQSNDLKTDETNSCAELKDASPPNSNGNSEINETLAAVSQLEIQGE
ncbi:actin-histidine N-methyltransferase-like [Porites lutea]|uniref:actin-histidine N-methyltransferase-like n=1 Tax=Porites lutea TaxID=51062 RepID=UPI003CC63CCF